MLSEAQARFLGSRRVGHLATADARGSPHLVPVCFAVSEGALYITIDQKPKGDVGALKRLRNIIENPVAAFVADRWDEDWSRLGWVMLRGPAEILSKRRFTYRFALWRARRRNKRCIAFRRFRKPRLGPRGKDQLAGVLRQPDPADSLPGIGCGSA